MPFFEPLPPLPEPEFEQTEWRPPLWDRPSEASIGAPAPIVALLAKTDEVALVLTNVAAYRNGFTFDLVVQRNPMAARQPHEHPGGWFMGLPHMGRGPRIGFEFADGTRVTQQGPSFAGQGTVLKAHLAKENVELPAGPILVTRGGNGDQDRLTMGFWSSPLPPRGPMHVYAEFTTVGVAETMTVVDASPIVDAAQHAIELWEPPQTR